MLAQPTVVFANNELNINKEETQKATSEFVNFFMSQFNNLQKQITDVTQKNLELEAKIEKLQKENSTFTQKNLELEAKILKLKELQEQYVSDYATLQEETSSNKSELEKVKKEIVSSSPKFKDHYASKSELEKVKEEIVSSSQKFKDHYVSKSELENLIKDIIQTFNALIDKLLGKAN